MKLHGGRKADGTCLCDHPVDGLPPRAIVVYVRVEVIASVHAVVHEDDPEVVLYMTDT